MNTDLLDRAAHAPEMLGDAAPDAAWQHPTPHAEARNGAGLHAPIPAAWLSALLEDVDIGLLLVSATGQVLFANYSAERSLAADRSGLWQADVHPQHPDRKSWKLQANRAGVLDAVRATIARRSRKLLTLDVDHGSGTVAVLPFEPAPHAALLVLGRQQVCEPLTIQCFALAHQLTCSESRVLLHLCEGLAPAEIAERQGVLLSTVRTQLGAIRTKTGTHSIGTLVRRIAALPPMLSSLGRRPSLFN